MHQDARWKFLLLMVSARISVLVLSEAIEDHFGAILIGRIPGIAVTKGHNHAQDPKKHCMDSSNEQYSYSGVAQSLHEERVREELCRHVPHAVTYNPGM